MKKTNILRWKYSVETKSFSRVNKFVFFALLFLLSFSFVLFNSTKDRDAQDFKRIENDTTNLNEKFQEQNKGTLIHDFRRCMQDGDKFDNGQRYCETGFIVNNSSPEQYQNLMKLASSTNWLINGQSEGMANNFGYKYSYRNTSSFCRISYVDSSELSFSCSKPVQKYLF